MASRRKLMFTLVVVGLLVYSSVIYAARRGPMLSLSNIWTFETIDNVRLDMEDREKIASAKSRLYRSDTELCMEIDTRNLPAGGAFTTWWVLFNSPDDCEHGSGFGGARCGTDDPRSVFWFAGETVGPNGEGHFNNCVEVGSVPNPAQCIFDSDAGDCAWDNPNAEIHAIIGRYHGMAQYDDATALGEQISTLNGYCSELPNGCPDLQIAIHAK